MKIVTRKLRRLRSLKGRERRMFAVALILLPLFWVRSRLFGPRAFAAALAAAGQPAREAGSASSPGGKTAALALDELTRIGALVNSAAHHVLPAGNCLTRKIVGAVAPWAERGAF
jgi:hypothetical protein